MEFPDLEDQWDQEAPLVEKESPDIQVVEASKVLLEEKESVVMPVLLVRQDEMDLMELVDRWDQEDPLAPQVQLDIMEPKEKEETPARLVLLDVMVQVAHQEFLVPKENGETLVLQDITVQKVNEVHQVVMDTTEQMETWELLVQSDR